MQKKQKGITLIALIITIIVLLILAGVSISLVVGNNGVLTQASNSVVANREAKAKEEVEMAWASAEAEYFGEWAQDTSLEKDEAYYASKLPKYLSSTGTLQSVESNGDGTYTVKYQSNDQGIEYTFTVDAVGKVTTSSSGTGTTTPSDPTPPVATTYTITYNGNEGTVSKASDTLEAGATITFATATRDGYVFKGWYDSSTGGNKITYTTMPSSNTEVYAGWVEVPNIGASVTYTPSGSYTWDNTKSSSTGSGTTSLSSASGGDFRITSWKVFSVDGTNVKLVPSAPTTGTVELSDYEGYNNGVKLLNDACSALYKTGTAITAQSISIDDIEPILTSASYGNAYTIPTPTQTESAFTEKKNYPSIYADEKLSVVTNGETTTSKGNTGLGLSEQSAWKTGKVTRATSIQPYETYYYLRNSNFSSYLGTTYSNMLIPNGSSTPRYWVASRCVVNGSGDCDFCVRCVGSGGLSTGSLYSSKDSPYSFACRLFPVVSLSSGLLSGDNSNGFTVDTSGL